MQDKLQDKSQARRRDGARKPLLDALQGQTLTPPPVWLMRQAGRYLPEYRALRGQAPDFLTFCYTPDLAVEATLQPVRRFALDAAILFADILVIPDALGQQVGFAANNGPQLTPLRTAQDVAQLSLDRARRHVRPVFETIRAAAAALPPHVALIGFAGAPWTVAAYMVEGGGSPDFRHALRWAATDPEPFGTLIEALIQATVGYLCGQIEAGVEVVQIFDSWAGLLRPDQAAFDRWVIEPTRRIVAGVRQSWPEIPIIGFPRGAGERSKDYLLRTGVTAIGLDQTIDPLWAARALQPHAPVQGNLDPEALRAGGLALEKQARRVLDALSGGPFIFNLGHGVHKETPPDHVAALLDIVRRA